MEDPKKTPKEEEDEKKLQHDEKKKKFLEQIKQLRETQEMLQSKKGPIKSEYKFWETQPVIQFYRDSNKEQGPIQKENKIESEKKEPYTLPEGYEWKNVDLEQTSDIDKLYEFLKSNYIEDDMHLFRTEYSKDFLKWYLSAPNMHKDWIISVLKEDPVKKKKKMVGFISAIPAKISVKGVEVETAKVNLLCVKKELRGHRLAPVLMMEITRRIHLENIWQGVYASFNLVPSPFARGTFYYRNLNLKKLIDVQFAFLPSNTNLSKALKHYDLGDEAPISEFRKMEEKDLDEVYQLITKNNLSKFKIFDVLSKDEVKYWFLPRNNIVYSYVLEDENKKITDFFCFYNIPKTVLKNDKYKKINCAFSVANVTTTVTNKDLLKTTMIYARDNNMDVYYCLDYPQNTVLFKEFLFIEKDRKIKYYLYNYVCPDSLIEDVSLMFI